MFDSGNPITESTYSKNAVRVCAMMYVHCLITVDTDYGLSTRAGLWLCSCVSCVDCQPRPPQVGIVLSAAAAAAKGREVIYAGSSYYYLNVCTMILLALCIASCHTRR